ncbi:DgyrCDS7169 [Dimorphilus gyrociliatus]|uniref:DgyrCDS7169 n=1 Tax=Dimorphilus gyrociliatus TaxID=2664684 RepID=A0A7I8VQG2_9ANNE|nr:DgyrCDS7169 [Dimorphilus gyrociliatus]
MKQLFISTFFLSIGFDLNSIILIQTANTDLGDIPERELTPIAPAPPIDDTLVRPTESWGTWGTWSSCTSTCGSGSRTATRTCLTSTCSQGSSKRSETCNANSCPVNGGWSAWSDWGSCSVTCGAGTRGRTRQCNNPSPSEGGSECSGSGGDSEECTLRACPINGGWSAWSNWGSCSVTCGAGTRGRTRQCNNPSPSEGGSECSGSGGDSEECTLRACPINGGWSAWSNWGSCSVTCGAGTRGRTRQCNNPSPSEGGSECSGSGGDSEECTLRACPINGGWSAWSNWGSCSVTCGTGTRGRTRQCNNPSPSEGGSECSGSGGNSEECTLSACPINGGWSAWSNWGSCSVTCGAGTRGRTRQCNNPSPSEGGSECSGSGGDSEECTMSACPTSGGWSAWGVWESCSATCGSGIKISRRVCTNSGDPCEGDGIRYENCLLRNCGKLYLVA